MSVLIGMVGYRSGFKSLDLPTCQTTVYTATCGQACIHPRRCPLTLVHPLIMHLVRCRNVEGFPPPADGARVTTILALNAHDCALKVCIQKPVGLLRIEVQG